MLKNITFLKCVFRGGNIDLSYKYCGASIGVESLPYKDGAGREERGTLEKTTIFFLWKYVLFGNTPFRRPSLLGL